MGKTHSRNFESALTHGGARASAARGREAEHDNLGDQVAQAFQRAPAPAHTRRQVASGYGRHNDRRNIPCILPEFQNPGNPDDMGVDGVDHINIWEHAATPLGQALAQVTDMPFVIPGYGKFRCVDGFWHYLRDPQHKADWREISGQAARRTTVPKEFACQPFDFYFKIACAVWFKLTTYPALAKAFVENELPLDMWYTRFDDQNSRCRAIGIWGKLMSIYSTVRVELAKWVVMTEQEQAEFIPNFDFFLMGNGTNHSTFTADHWPKEAEPKAEAKPDSKRTGGLSLESFMQGARLPAPKNKSKDPLVGEINALIAKADGYLNNGARTQAEYESLASDVYFLESKVGTGSEVAKTKYIELQSMVSEVKVLGEPVDAGESEPTAQDRYVTQAEVVLQLMANPERDENFAAEMAKLQALYAELPSNVVELYAEAYNRICAGENVQTA